MIRPTSWAPAKILAIGAISLPYLPFNSFPCLSIFLFLYPTLPSSPVSTLPFLLQLKHSMGEHCKSPPPSVVWGRARPQSPLRSMLNRWNMSCSNDFGSFCANQNVTIDANLALYIFQGRASASSCPRLWAPIDYLRPPSHQTKTIKTALRPENFDKRSAVVVEKEKCAVFKFIIHIYYTSWPGAHCT